MTPLTSLDFGSRFPFGAFGYVTAVLDLFDVTPQAPSFDLPITTAASGRAGTAFGTRHFAGSLSFLDTYMVIVRGLMSFALWVGAIWYVGARLLGFHAAGDMSEAADDGGVT